VSCFGKSAVSLTKEHCSILGSIRWMQLNLGALCHRCIHRTDMTHKSVSSVPSSPFSLPDPVLITVIIVPDSVTMFLNIAIFIPPVLMLTRMHPEFSVSVLSHSCCSSCIHSCSNTLSLILCSSPYLSSIVHPLCYSVFRPPPSYS